MTHPVVTVIIATFDSADTLRDAMASVLDQSFSDFELIVVGDGCTDHTQEVVAGFADQRVIWVDLPTNSGGPGIPRDRALALARGRYIAYQGHDDIWFPDHLRTAVAHIEATDVDLVSTQGVAVRPDGSMYRFSLPSKSGGHGYEGGLSPSTWLHRADLPAAELDWTGGPGWGEDRTMLERWRNAGRAESVADTITVVKFTSGDWRLYRDDTPRPPTADWRAAVFSDPAATRERVGREALTHRVVGPTGRFVRRLVDRVGRRGGIVGKLIDMRSRRRRGLRTLRRARRQ